MNKQKNKVIKYSNFSIAFFMSMMLFMPIFAEAAEFEFPPKPVFINASDSNVVAILDDSGSMDWEILVEGGLLGYDYQASSNNYGFYRQDGSGDNVLVGGDRYAYLFPSGTDNESPYDRGLNVYGDWVGGTNVYNFVTVPPFPQYGYTRSADYNKQYYNPDIRYYPWSDEVSPASGGPAYANITDFTAVPLEPALGSNSRTMSLVGEIAAEDPDDYGWPERRTKVFRTAAGMVIPKDTDYIRQFNNDDGAIHNTSDDLVLSDYTLMSFPYKPATYFRVITTGSYTVDGGSGTCASPDPSNYRRFDRAPSTLTGVDALAYDGSCLEEVNIESGNTYTNTEGRSDCDTTTDEASCTYQEEMTNFANWFSYYRKRHQTLRSSMGRVLSEQKGIRFSQQVISNASADLALESIDNNNIAGILGDLYNVVGRRGGTPNRQALDSVGRQFNDNSDNLITGSCQKNFVIQFTDGFSNGSDPSGVANEDGSLGAPYADGQSTTLADVAAKYYNTRLAEGNMDAGNVTPDLGCEALSPGEVSILDCNTNLHLNFYGVSFGVSGRDVYNQTVNGVTFNSVADAYQTNFNWPTSMGTSDARQIDDLYHAAVNGHGEMYNADSPESLLQGLRQAFNSIQAKTGIGSSVSFNSSQLEADSKVFIATFNSGVWTGDVQEYDLDSAGDLAVDSNWSAAEKLDARGHNSRAMYVTGKNGPMLFKASNFTNLTTEQKADLKKDPLNQDSTNAVAKKRIKYLRGNTNPNVVSEFRERESRLGDIIHSSPVYVAQSRTDDPNGIGLSGFDDFVNNDTTSRQPVVYVGSNDGMLHAFSTQNGKELMAYIPSQVFSDKEFEGLHFLTDPAYSHHFYVDNTPAVGNVYDGTNWKTVLVGGLRSGGKGLYALDVTDPVTDQAAANTEAAAQNSVLWEFTHDDLGYTFSQPDIVRLNDDKWYAVLGNGYNHNDGKAKLFLIDVNNPTGVPIILDTGVGGTDNVGELNGLSTPTLIDLDDNGTMDRAYAGDYKGNMWAFDLSDTNNNNWDVAFTSGLTNAPLFSAGLDQPITTKPVVIDNTDDSVSSPGAINKLVLFGTGSLLTDSDKVGPFDQQYFIAAWDSGAAVSAGFSALVEHDISTTADVVSGRFVREFSSSNDVDYSSDKGWYVSLPIDGERISVSPVAINDNIAFATNIPNTVSCGDNGSSWLFLVTALDGSPVQGAPFDLNNDGEFNSADGGSDGNDNQAVGVSLNDLGAATGLAGLGNSLYVSGPGNPKPLRFSTPPGASPDVDEGRFSWEQLISE